MKTLKSIRIVAALILTLTTIALVPVNTVAAANNGKYVSEVYVAYGKDAGDAKKTLSDKGFTAVDGNLNDGGKTYAMMGYKTTDNIRDSITDLAVMNMRGDYSVEDYKTMLKSQKTQIAEFLEEFMAVIKEYRANYKAGKAKAIYAHDALNNYTEDDTGMKMGDLLNSETLQDRVGIKKSIEAENPDKLPDLVTILMQGNAPIIKSIETLLSMATDTADNSWIDRFAKLDYDALLDKLEDERPDLNTETKRAQYLDNVYGDDAGLIGVEAIELRNKLNDYEEMNLHVDTATEEQIKKAFGDPASNDKAMIQIQQWLDIGVIYENLKNFKGGNFAKGEMLDFFLEENDPEDTEIFIPVAASLSDGQRYGLPFVNLESLLRYAFTDEEGWNKVFEKYKNNLKIPKAISVYQNIDRNLYKEDGSVALTSAAQRANNTVTVSNGDVEQDADLLTNIANITYTLTTISIAAVILSGVFTVYYVRNAAIDPLTHKWVQLDWDRIFDNKAFNEYASTFNPQNYAHDGVDPGFYHLGEIKQARFAILMSKIVAVVTMALAVMSAVLTIIDLCRSKSYEQLPIPNYLVDNYTDADGGSYSINYKAVECNRSGYFGADYKKQSGSSADIYADEGKQWLVLYASKNSKAGKPLTPDFILQEDYNAPRGYDRNVHLIGEKGAINVVSAGFKSYTAWDSSAAQDELKLWRDTLSSPHKVYVFIKQSKDKKTYDESAGNMTASTIGGGMIAAIGFGCLFLGGALGAVITVLIKKRKKETV